MKVSPEIEAEILSRPGTLVNGNPISQQTAVTLLAGDAPPLDLDEKAFQQRIIDFAVEAGWLCYHTHESRKSKEGFPDLVLTRRGEIIFAEIKTTKGKVSEAQAEWLDALGLHVPCCEHCKIGVYLWRPNDWDDIVKVLK